MEDEENIQKSFELFLNQTEDMARQIRPRIALLFEYEAFRKANKELPSFDAVFEFLKKGNTMLSKYLVENPIFIDEKIHE